MEGTQSKILFITRNFPPLTGGMERLMYQVVNGLSYEHDIILIGPKGCSTFTLSNIKCYELPFHPLTFILLSTILAPFLAMKHKVEFVIGGNGLVAPAVAITKFLTRIKSIIYVHGLDLVINNHFYQMLFIPLIRYADLTVANSRNTANIAGSKKINTHKISVIHPAVEFPEISISGCSQDFRRKYSLEKKKILLYVGRIIKRKGLHEFIERSLPDIVTHCEYAHLVVIGDHPQDAAGSHSNLIGKITTSINKNNLSEKVYFLGKTDDQTLIKAYCAADLLVFPVIEVDGDVEGFGMVAIEAAACGTQTIAFEADGVPDAIENNVSGLLIAADNYDELSREILKIISTDKNNVDNCINFANQFTVKKHLEKLKQAIQKLSGK